MFGIVNKPLKSGRTGKLSEPLYQCASAVCTIFQDENRASTAPVSVFTSKDKKHALIIRGEVYNLETLGCRKKGCLAEAVWSLYQSRGEVLFHELNGAFIIAVWNDEERTLKLIRDRIGILQVFYKETEDGFVFGSDPARVQQLSGDTRVLNHDALIQYLLYCYNPGTASLYQGVNRLRPAHQLLLKDGKTRIHRYWDIRFSPDPVPPAREWGEQIRDALDKAVRIRQGAEATGAFLSGGLDSSSVVSLLNRHGVQDLSTFSFRCRGESFDESHYAKIVADTCGTRHQLIEYGREDILLAEPMVHLMDEPFCDVGINVASYLLARAAGGKTRLIFTGDGGDELFAGHPVYMADKMSRFFGKMPPFILGPLFAFGRSLPDSEQKKDWKVKLKRFSESYTSFPEPLGTQRWRIYYALGELNDLLNPELSRSLTPESVFGPMIRYNEQANGPDVLSRSLHADYQTVVQFYLRRMEMARAFGLSPRFPMLDPEIVELCARIPSRYKIKGWDDTKYIEKVAVEPLLPREIVYRKDKLGHSIPLKNWMREQGDAGSFIKEVIFDSLLKNRQFFNPEYVRTLWDEHQAKTRNHSHRLWALAVLELWLRAKKI